MVFIHHKLFSCPHHPKIFNPKYLKIKLLYYKRVKKVIKKFLFMKKIRIFVKKIKYE